MTKYFKKCNWKKYWLFRVSIWHYGRGFEIFDLWHSKRYLYHSDIINMNNIINIVLAILFFLCLADMPYGYYAFVRSAGLIGFAILAYQANHQGRQTEMIIYGGLS
jgi:hypothetical protein